MQSTDIVNAEVLGLHEAVNSFDDGCKVSLGQHAPVGNSAILAEQLLGQRLALMHLTGVPLVAFGD